MAKKSKLQQKRAQLLMKSPGQSPREPCNYNRDLPIASLTSRTWLAAQALFGLTGQIARPHTPQIQVIRADLDCLAICSLKRLR
jgi:hypothetical protein